MPIALEGGRSRIVHCFRHDDVLAVWAVWSAAVESLLLVGIKSSVGRTHLRILSCHLLGCLSFAELSFRDAGDLCLCRCVFSTTPWLP